MHAEPFPASGWHSRRVERRLPPPGLADRLFDQLYALHPVDRMDCWWVASLPMLNWLADVTGQPRPDPTANPVAMLLGRPVRRSDDPGGLRLDHWGHAARLP